MPTSSAQHAIVAKYESAGVLTDASTMPKYVLSVSAHPNPFNPRTTLRYTVPASGRVTIGMYDANGARVATLLDAEKTAGAYTLEWEGQDDSGRSVTSGVYFARLSLSGETRSYRIVLLK